MRAKLLAATAAVVAVSACTPQMQAIGTVAVEQRRMMNDAQARLTTAAMCDISVGAFYRELSETERSLIALVCGGIFPGTGVPSAVSVQPAAGQETIDPVPPAMG